MEKLKSISKKLSLACFGAMFASQAAFAGILDGANKARPEGTPGSLFGDDSAFQTIANVLIFLVGAIAVIMLILGGLRYVISQGSSEQVKQAKDTILYSIIGIVVAILAYAIVNFVATSLKP